MAIFKLVNVKFANSSHDCQTRVNIDSTIKQINDYFIGKDFNFGCQKYDHDKGELIIDDMHQCIDIDIEQPFCEVIDGSFKGASGYITGKMTKGCYFLQCEQTLNKLLVTTSQLEQIYI